MAVSQGEISPRDPPLPIAISLIAGRYLIFEVEAAIYLRREHNICGYNIGTLAQIPSQNVFLGLPVILMPEEAQVLVDEGIAYVLDDTKAHKAAMYDRELLRVEEYREQINRQAEAVQSTRAKEEAANQKKYQRQRASKDKSNRHDDRSEGGLLEFEDADASSEVADSTTSKQDLSVLRPHITPTLSGSLLDHGSYKVSAQRSALPNLPPNYPLFRHLHQKRYFMTPGLRFGCQYTTYPGDPLRFHSHFLTSDLGWKQGISLMDIVGGGRLGTGVKKGFLIGSHKDGGKEPNSENNVRTFSVEWAVM